MYQQYMGVLCDFATCQFEVIYREVNKPETNDNRKEN